MPDGVKEVWVHIRGAGGGERLNLGNDVYGGNIVGFDADCTNEFTTQ